MQRQKIVQKKAITCEKLSDRVKPSEYFKCNQIKKKRTVPFVVCDDDKIVLIVLL